MKSVIVIIGTNGDVGLHVAYHLLCAGTAIRSSANCLDPATFPDGVADNREQRIDPATSWNSAELAV